MNLFDNLQNQLFNTTTSVFGYDAEWQPSAGGALQVARVHFKKPNEERAIAKRIEFDPFIFTMEYKEGDFVGLAESVRNGNNENVLVDGKTFYVREIIAHWDGKTYRAQLENL